MPLEHLCSTCTNPRESDCQYCIGTGGKDDNYERETVIVNYVPTVTISRLLLKGSKHQYELPLLPSKSK